MVKATYDPNNDGVIAITNGGTGSSTDSGARTNLGLGTMSTQNANSVNITGGSITGITDLAVADGGTGTSNGSITGTDTSLMSIASHASVVSNTGGADLSITSGAGNGTGSGGDIDIIAGDGGSNGYGGWFTGAGGDGLGSKDGGYAQIVAGNGGATGSGGKVRIYAGDGGSTSGAAGSIEIFAGTPTDGRGGSITLVAQDGAGTNHDGGDVEIYLGNKTGSGLAGRFNIYPLGSGGIYATLNFDSIASSRIYTFEDRAGAVYTVGGGTVAAANDFTPNAGNLTIVSGATQINGIATAKRTTGDIIVLTFQSNPSVKHNTAASAGFASLYLSGSADFSASADDTLTLIYDGTYWREIARTII
jgi:hypothetical protein